MNGCTRSADGGHIALQPPHQSTTPLERPASASSTCGAPDTARSGSNTPPAAASQSAACFGQPYQRSSRSSTQQQASTIFRLRTRAQTSEETAVRWRWCAAAWQIMAGLVHCWAVALRGGQNRAAYVLLLSSAVAVGLCQLTDVGRRSVDDLSNVDPDAVVEGPGSAGTGVRPSQKDALTSGEKI